MWAGAVGWRQPVSSASSGRGTGPRRAWDSGKNPIREGSPPPSLLNESGTATIPVEMRTAESATAMLPGAWSTTVGVEGVTEKAAR